MHGQERHLTSLSGPRQVKSKDTQGLKSIHTIIPNIGNQPVSTVVEFTCRMRYRRFDGDATGVLISSV